MDQALVVVAVAVLGAAVGVVGGWGVWGRGRRAEAPPAPEPPEAQTDIDAGVEDLLNVLRSSAIVVDSSDAVVLRSPMAVALGLVRDCDLAHARLKELARAVRRDRTIREEEFDVPRGPLGDGRLVLGVRATPLGSRHVLLLVEDNTMARRVEDVRRDFVANVSHELKTPVGGISLLAEAVLDARDDPVAVERFAGRIRVESARLTRLVQEIVDLSRLQAAQPLEAPTTVDVGEVVREAVDETQMLAEARGGEVAVTVEGAPTVYADSRMLVTAVSNLLSNAVNYSPTGTRVALTAGTRGDVVEIAVTDQGCGIAPAEQERIFERFYRVDPARSRATGGTGLGLAIVKHICSNHGGEVTVWSAEGEGSTFTIRLPSARARVQPSGGAAPGDHPLTATREVSR